MHPLVIILACIGGICLLALAVIGLIVIVVTLEKA